MFSTTKSVQQTFLIKDSDKFVLLILLIYNAYLILFQRTANNINFSLVT